MASTFTIRENFHMALYGVSGIAENREWGRTGMALMDTLWKEVKSRQMPNKGINVWVYEPGNGMFCGAELSTVPPQDTILQHREILMPRYAHFLHIGPYHTIPASFNRLKAAFEQAGIKTGLPYLEIYGHWQEDESKLETELLWTIGAALD
jgi:effector-binding domain-containing protein